MKILRLWTDPAALMRRRQGSEHVMRRLDLKNCGKIDKPFRTRAWDRTTLPVIHGSDPFCTCVWSA